DLLQKDLDEVNKDHINSVNNLESILTNLQKETEKLVANHQHKINSLDTEKIKQEQEHQLRESKLESENSILNHQLHSKEEELQLIKDSISWKFTRLITWPLRMFDN
ncbi:MAG: hypothetical protein GQ527_11935, partial [Bacteroidales bacterium]|nr:hypothetical protein [Bacteroidales bacterium]